MECISLGFLLLSFLPLSTLRENLQKYHAHIFPLSRHFLAWFMQSKWTWIWTNIIREAKWTTLALWSLRLYRAFLMEGGFFQKQQMRILKRNMFSFCSSPFKNNEVFWNPVHWVSLKRPFHLQRWCSHAEFNLMRWTKAPLCSHRASLN